VVAIVTKHENEAGCITKVSIFMVIINCFGFKQSFVIFYIFNFLNMFVVNSSILCMHKINDDDAFISPFTYTEFVNFILKNSRNK